MQHFIPSPGESHSPHEGHVALSLKLDIIGVGPGNNHDGLSHFVRNPETNVPFPLLHKSTQKGSEYYCNAGLDYQLTFHRGDNQVHHRNGRSPTTATQPSTSSPPHPQSPFPTSTMNSPLSKKNSLSRTSRNGIVERPWFTCGGAGEWLLASFHGTWFEGTGVDHKIGRLEVRKLGLEIWMFLSRLWFRRGRMIISMRLFCILLNWLMSRMRRRWNRLGGRGGRFWLDLCEMEVWNVGIEWWDWRYSIERTRNK